MKFQEFVDIAQIGQDVADQILPRQAIVTRAEGNGVRVRFSGPGQLTEPESWFVSTVAGLPAGSMGWVYMVHGGKGLFVATGTPRTLYSPIVTGPNITVGTGAYTVLATTTIEGMVPGLTYRIVTTGATRVSPTGSSAFIARSQVNGNNSLPYTYFSTQAGGPAVSIPLNFPHDIVAPANGTATVTVGVVWNSGSAPFSNSFVSAIAIPA